METTKQNPNTELWSPVLTDPTQPNVQGLLCENSFSQ